MAKYGVPESVAGLARHHLVLYAEPMQRYGVGLRWLEAQRRENTVIIRVDNLQSAEQLIAYGQGIGSLTCYQGDINPALVRVFPEPFAFHPGYLVYHASLRDTARIRAALGLHHDILKHRIRRKDTRRGGVRRIQNDHWHFYAILFGMETTIDSAGRVVVPKALRDVLGFRPGQSLEVRAVDGRLEIVAAPVAMRLTKRGKGSIAVPAEPLPALTAEAVRETLERVRR